MKVIGIDPGTASCGFGIVHERDGRLRAIDHGWWQTPAAERPELRLKTIYDEVAALIAAHRPDSVALEDSFVGADARTALFVGQARGAVMVAVAQQSDLGDTRRVIAVIGDGSMTGGMAFEGLNNLGHSGRNAIIILNDNGRSYAPTASKLGSGLRRLVPELPDLPDLPSSIARAIESACACAICGARFTASPYGTPSIAITSTRR